VFFVWREVCCVYNSYLEIFSIKKRRAKRIRGIWMCRDVVQLPKIASQDHLLIAGVADESIEGKKRRAKNRVSILRCRKLPWHSS
jgi:hypothetical protein